MRSCLLALALALFAVAAAQLPPAEEAYERFRRWANALPAGEPRTGPEVWSKYREHLRAQGVPADEGARQVEALRARGNQTEVARWNRILTAPKPMFNTAPNEFLVEMARARQPGRALDVGMGQGRNAIWLAQQGWRVTGFDPAEKAVEAALATASRLGVKLDARVNSIEAFDFGETRWDLILLSYVGAREAAAVYQRALAPGGVLVVEGFHRDATRGGVSIGGSVVFDTGELPALFPSLRVVRYEEPVRAADFGGPAAVRVVRYCAERPRQ